MPAILMFYGIVIRIKHHEPHIHAEYQGNVAVYAIHDSTLFAGIYRREGRGMHGVPTVGPTFNLNFGVN